MRPTKNATLLPLALALGLLSSSCVVLAGAGLGYVVSQQVLPNAVHEAQVADEVDVVWANVLETADILVDVGTEVEANDFPRRLKATIDGADVTVEVEAHDIDRTLIRVTAEKYLGADSATAESVMNRILSRLSAQEE